MSETLLKVEKRDDGQYIVERYGREFGLLASPIKELFHYDQWCPGRQPTAEISFTMFELPPPAPAPAVFKRTWGSVMGLRRPR